ncbi:Sir2 family NAD-dependent protein deacetylase [Microvirga terrae]|uniref:protein acetyllysine N-acetyltransferase n=1 Tax=Microvirga terrae TaxID=2740529 RepID=A0ABY5RMW9_9HYPH|nr:MULTISPECIES: Sir2 family NAD-dependent protein deacetylase [Microvirga]MBQ0823040.1 Sir2 family NAD-dependent protein deacetylase [Microvirga sp. HBU67558]UVF17689.1 Sir2 family NAD-dependent protein deacetylase [Microvirga terrae]
MIQDARVVAGFTGAGISTESGIPDFRSPDSPWMRHKPISFALFLQSPEARRDAWRRKFAMDDLYRGARPSTGHRGFASLVATGRMPAVITQNIDGLHQESGLAPDQVIELHGNGTYAKCLACGTRHELDWVRRCFDVDGDPPDCRSCGGILKTATISFGQTMPEEPMRRAQKLTASCDLFLVAGSSLVVYPAAAFPAFAKENGARLVIVNREPTPLDRVADLAIHAEIGSVFSVFLS